MSAHSLTIPNTGSIRVGDRVKVCAGSGLDSDKEGIVLYIKTGRLGRVAKILTDAGDTIEMYTKRLFHPERR